MRCTICDYRLEAYSSKCPYCCYPNPMFYPKQPPHNLNIFGTGGSLPTDDINIGSTHSGTTIGYGWGGLGVQNHLGAMGPYKEDVKKINKVKLLLK